MKPHYENFLKTQLLWIILLSCGCVPKKPEEKTKMTYYSTYSETSVKKLAGNKLLCFGRYALLAPEEAELIIGAVSIPDDVSLIRNEPDMERSYVADEISRIEEKSRTAKVTFNAAGPVEDSWQIRYFEDKFAEADGSLFFSTFVTKGKYTFAIGDAVHSGEKEEDAAVRQSLLAKSISIREEMDIPSDSGFCLQQGFVPDAHYTRQEMVSAGIYLPSLPDVSFSVSSNKNAYIDYSKEEFDNRVREELSLLARIKAAKDQQGIHYPKRTLLREGTRTVQHWKGEESLIRRSDGTHDFEWAFVGTPGDVANPSEFNVKMYTKVAHNMVGAADKASLTDEEAIALWDKLLSGLKFRVKVPGAPEGSYYFLPGEATGGGEKP